jgi:hypothetical protein
MFDKLNFRLSYLLPMDLLGAKDFLRRKANEEHYFDKRPWYALSVSHRVTFLGESTFAFRPVFFLGGSWLVGTLYAEDIGTRVHLKKFPSFTINLVLLLCPSALLIYSGNFGFCITWILIWLTSLLSNHFTLKRIVSRFNQAIVEINGKKISSSKIKGTTETPTVYILPKTLKILFAAIVSGFLVGMGLFFVTKMNSIFEFSYAFDVAWLSSATAGLLGYIFALVKFRSKFRFSNLRQTFSFFVLGLMYLIAAIVGGANIPSTLTRCSELVKDIRMIAEEPIARIDLSDDYTCKKVFKSITDQNQISSFRRSLKTAKAYQPSHDIIRNEGYARITLKTGRYTILQWYTKNNLSDNLILFRNRSIKARAVDLGDIFQAAFE